MSLNYAIASAPVQIALNNGPTLLITNRGANPVYLGSDTNITTLTGYAVAAGATATWNANTPLWAITAVGLPTTLDIGSDASSLYDPNAVAVQISSLLVGPLSTAIAAAIANIGAAQQNTAVSLGSTIVNANSTVVYPVPGNLANYNSLIITAQVSNPGAGGSYVLLVKQGGADAISLVKDFSPANDLYALQWTVKLDPLAISNGVSLTIYTPNIVNLQLVVGVYGTTATLPEQIKDTSTTFWGGAPYGNWVFQGENLLSVNLTGPVTLVTYVPPSAGINRWWLNCFSGTAPTSVAVDQAISANVAPIYIRLMAPSFGPLVAKTTLSWDTPGNRATQRISTTVPAGFTGTLSVANIQ